MNREPRYDEDIGLIGALIALENVPGPRVTQANLWVFGCCKGWWGSYDFEATRDQQEKVIRNAPRRPIYGDYAVLCGFMALIMCLPAICIAACVGGVAFVLGRMQGQKNSLPPASPTPPPASQSQSTAPSPATQP
ncbi:unnamed protein product, partial [Mesorhabditis spiculigera]